MSTESDDKPVWDTQKMCEALKTLDETGKCVFDGCEFDGAFIVLVSPEYGQVCGLHTSFHDKVRAFAAIRDSVVKQLKEEAMVLAEAARKIRQ